MEISVSNNLRVGVRLCVLPRQLRRASKSLAWLKFAMPPCSFLFARATDAPHRDHVCG